MSLPFHFHGRDFSDKNNMYLQRLLECTSFLRLFTVISSKHNKSLDLNDKTHESSRLICVCPRVMKCQHLIIHNPLLFTAEYATKICSMSLKNGDRNGLYVNYENIKIGNKSTITLATIKHKNINKPLLSQIFLSVYINPKTNRPHRVCNHVRDQFANYISIQTNKKKNKIQDLEHELKRNMDRMTNLLSIINNNYNNSNNNNNNDDNGDDCLFECRLQVQHTDFAYGHLNNATYGKFIENTLYEYCKQYYNGKYLIHSLTMNLIKSATIKQIGNGLLPFCVVKIYDDIIYNKLSREIVGIIEQNHRLCAQFKLILIVDTNNRCEQIRSSL